jgi:hypothetical protein
VRRLTDFALVLGGFPRDVECENWNYARAGEPCLYNHDARAAAKACQSAIASHESRLQGFGEGKIGSVIRRRTVTQLPDSPKQGDVRIASQREIRQIVEGRGATVGRNHGRTHIAPHNLCNFQIDQMWRVERLAWREYQPLHAARCRSLQ